MLLYNFDYYGFLQIATDLELDDRKVALSGAVIVSDGHVHARISGRPAIGHGRRVAAVHR